MVRAKKPKKKGRGRPIEPNSLRQSGVRFTLRIHESLRSLAAEKAAQEGRSLAHVIQTLLTVWIVSAKSPT
jgi:predicted HicB family RNase H-like nuclease